MGFNGQYKGGKNLMYALNKQEQNAEYKFVIGLANEKKIEIDLPCPIETRISIKKWDEKLYIAIEKLGLTKRKYWELLKSENLVP